MKTRPFSHDSRFWIQAIALITAGLLLGLWPDWGHAPMAQTVSSPTVSPTSHDFGTVVVGNTQGLCKFTLNNSLLTNIILTSVQATAPFSAVDGCPSVLAPGVSCTVQVSFAPVSAGTQNGTLSIAWETNLPPPPPGKVNPSGTMTASLTGTGVSRLIAVADSATTAPDTAVSIAVLANDSGGQPPLRLAGVTTPTHGVATINGDTVVYTPAADYVGVDSFSYTVRDAGTQTATAPVTVTVTARPLTAVADSATTADGKSVVINVLANDTGGVPPLRVASVTTPGHGSATTDGNTVTYTPDTGYKGTDGFGYTVSDATGQTASAAVTVAVDKENDLEDKTDNPNANKVGGVIGKICSDGMASANFLRDCNALVNAPNPGPALEQITPNTVGNAPDITQISAQAQMLNLRSRLSSVRSGIMGIDIERLNIQRGGWTLSGHDLRYLLASADGGGTPSAEVAPSPNLGALGIFASGSLDFGNRDTTENQTGFDFKAFALTVGIDYRFTDRLVLGTAASYVGNDNQYVSGSGSLDTHGYGLALYGTYYQSDNFYVDGILSYGWNDYDQQRSVNYSLPDTEVRQQFDSAYGGQQFFADIGTGYNFTRGALTFGPEVRLSYLNLRVDPFRERASNDDPGSAWALAIGEQDLQSLVSRLGGRVNYLIEQPWGVLQPQVGLNWLHEFKSNSRLVQGQFVEGANVPNNLFYLLVDPVDPNYFELSLGLTARFNKGPAAMLQYRTLLGYDHLDQNAITAQFRWEF